jgi:hypothetical protein
MTAIVVEIMARAEAVGGDEARNGSRGRCDRRARWCDCGPAGGCRYRPGLAATATNESLALP